MIELVSGGLRLIILGAFALLAIEDVRTRTCPRWVWAPIIAAGLLAIAVDTIRAYGTYTWFWHWFRIAGSIGLLGPMAGFFLISAAGNADAKAILALAIAFPTAPAVVWPTGVPFAVVAFLVSVVLALLGTAALVVADRFDRGLPFLAYLAAGLLVSAVAGNPVLLAVAS